MSYLLFEIKDNKDELHRVVVRDIGTILTINDEFMTKQIMARKGIEKIKYCSIKPNVENLTLSIRDYTLTDTIYSYDRTKNSTYAGRLWKCFCG